MAFFYNPLTGNLDYYEQSTGGSTSYTPGDPAHWNPDPSTVGDALDQLADRTTKYVQTFVSGDWTGPSGGEYSLVINEAAHLKGVYPTVTIYELVSGSYEEVTCSITIDNSGLITIKVLETPDNRFNGRVIIE